MGLSYELYINPGLTILTFIFSRPKMCCSASNLVVKYLGLKGGLLDPLT